MNAKEESRKVVSYFVFFVKIIVLKISSIIIKYYLSLLSFLTYESSIKLTIKMIDSKRPYRRIEIDKIFTKSNTSSATMALMRGVME
jgi:hypothetical protein